MGTLRIKRGTKTALQTSPGYVPAEGELKKQNQRNKKYRNGWIKYI